ncbi:MAG: dTDP-4-dehydrorhamnose reductase [Alphaproteobacteria bacterium]
MKKNIIFLGKNGQIANAFFLLTEKLDNKNNDFDCQFYSSSDVDLSNPVTTDLFLDSLPKNIDLIVNCMAYTNVDKAEEEQDLCNKINNISVGVIAKYCFSNNIKFIHFSTDYVFDGTGSEPFSEDNTANLHPLNFYGKTKLLGEQAIQKSGCDYIIIRLSWVYDARQTSKNFVNTIKRLAQEKEVLNIVCDQIGSPTSADFVAKNSMRIFYLALFASNEIQQKYYRRILHLNNGIFMSWHEFAVKIITDLRQNNQAVLTREVLPILSSQYPTKATRPLNSRLKSKDQFF